MSKSNALESDYLNHLFCNADIALVGDATGLVKSTASGSLYISLHTADVGETGNQTTSEATYTDYTRIGVERNSGKWTVSGTAPTQVQNANAITFPTCTGSSSLISHFAIGTAFSGAGKVLYYGTLSPNINITTGITPSIAALGLIVTED